jgi:site-specific DNA recombinase
VKPPARPLRCAIYTRKSTEHGLEQEFNSLDAQREAAEAYIKSQAHEGWRLCPERYDDGGLSGGSLERPALQALLAAVAHGRVDVIIVYKVDRLTRSLADFAKLVELFDKHGVSFVSVTQQFNTTNSMGRLTLNVLLSFAQFEREVTGERIRDKIAASKKKGIWMGGPAPLGYRVEGKKLLAHPTEAEQVRTIFSRYLELESLTVLMQDLGRRGIGTKGGTAFGKGALAYLVRNRIYLGEIRHQGRSYRGEHEPIIDRELFEAVQTKLTSQAQARRQARAGSDALLIGRIFDDRGNRMTPASAHKQGARYRYYVSAPLMQGRREEAGSVPRVPAPEIEQLVIESLRSEIAASGSQDDPPEIDRESVLQQVRRVEVRSGSVLVEIGPRPQETNGGDVAPPRVITVPWSPPPGRVARTVVVPPSDTAALLIAMRAGTRETLLVAIAKARRWLGELSSHQVTSFGSIAAREGCTERYVRSVLPLAFLAPAVVQAAVQARLPDTYCGSRLAANSAPSWNEQKRSLGLQN